MKLPDTFMIEKTPSDGYVIWDMPRGMGMERVIVAAFTNARDLMTALQSHFRVTPNTSLTIADLKYPTPQAVTPVHVAEMIFRE